MYLKYDYCLGFDGANHYSAIVMKKPTSPPPSQPTSPPPSKQPRELQEQSSENEEPLNIKDIQNQIEKLQNKKRRTLAKKEKGIKSICKIMKMFR